MPRSPLLLGFLWAAAASCSMGNEPRATRLCEPGHRVTCACMGGAEGFQTCGPEGTSYGACHCSGNPSGVGGGLGLGGTGGAVVPACDGGTDAAPEAGEPCDASSDAVTYTGDVAPVLARCTGELCHLAPSYASLVGKPAVECCDGRLLVSPGDPANSYLIDKLRDHDLCRGNAMPLGGPPLAPDRVQAISDWICLGAPDD